MATPNRAAPRRSPRSITCAALALTLSNACSTDAEPRISAATRALEEPTLEDLRAQAIVDIGTLGVEIPPDLLAVPLGGLRGTVNLAKDGTITYTVPIFTPEGPGSLDLELSLQYRSAPGDGFMGRGWSLISPSKAIRRCGRDFLHDDHREPPVDQQSSPLCLGPDRLVLVSASGSYGAFGTEYRTEVDPFSRILLLGNSSGRTSFQVFRPDGAIEYYNSDNSSAVLNADSRDVAWYLNRIENRYGIGASFLYALDVSSGSPEIESIRLVRIEYSGSAIGFGYSPRTQATSRFGHMIGGRTDLTHLLDTITIYDDLQPALRYSITYDETSDDHVPLLTSMRLCAEAGACLPATTFNYVPKAVGLETPQATEILQEPFLANIAPPILDLDGDGRDDLLFWDFGGTAQGSNHEIRVSYGSPLGLGESNTLVAATPHPWVLPFDLSGDGRRDLLSSLQSDGSVQWEGFLSTGTSVDGQGLIAGDPIPKLGTSPEPWQYPEYFVDERLLGIGDFDGNGRADLLICNDNNDTLIIMRDSANQGRAAGFYVHSLSDFFGRVECGDVLGVGDLDADGDSEILFGGTGYGLIAYGSWSASGPYSPSIPGGAPANIALAFANTNVPDPGDLRIKLMDLTGDGLPEIVGASNASQIIYYWVNRGNGSFLSFYSPAQYFHDGFSYLWTEELGPDIDAADVVSEAQVLDYNQDGRADLLFLDFQGDYIRIGPDFHPIDFGPDSVWLITTSPNDHRPGLVTTAPALEMVAQHPWIFFARPGDFDGDGAPDLSYFVPELDDPKNDWRLYQRLNVAPDVGGGLLAEIHELDADNPTYSIKYLNGASSVDRSECDYPIVCERPFHALVASYEVDGSQQVAGRRHYDVSYSGSRYAVLGEGWLGFRQLITSTVDSEGESTTQTTWFDRQIFEESGYHPWANRHTRIETRSNIIPPNQPATSFASVETVEWWHTLHSTGPNGRTYSVFPKLETRTVTEDGAALLQESRETTRPDVYGNVATETITTPESTVTIAREFSPEPATWLVSRYLGESITAVALPGLRTATRRHTRYYKAGTLDLERLETEPGDPTLRLNSTYTYDSWGNLIEVVDTPVAAPSTARRNVTFFDDYGVFPVWHRNAAGHVSFRSTDGLLGATTVSKDPIGVQSVYQLDGFGRTIRSRRDDGFEGTYVATLHPAAGSAGAPWYYSLNVTEAERQRTTYRIDHLERISSRITHRDGQDFEIHQRYDRDGRLTGRTIPLPGGMAPAADDWDVFTYDALGRLTDLTTRSGVTTYRYDGRLLTSTDPSGLVTETEYDLEARPKRERQAGGPWVVIDYGPFDVQSTLRIEGGHNLADYGHDAYGRVTSLRQPNGSQWVYSFNAFGEVVSEVHTNPSRGATPETWTITRDDLGRETLIERTPSTLPLIEKEWDTVAFGRLSSIKSEAAKIYYAYDQYGRVDGEVYYYTNSARVLQYEFGYSQYGTISHRHLSVLRGS